MMRFAFALKQFALICATLLVFSGAALAQITQEQKAEYQKWLDTAARAEQTLDSGRASTRALETLRGQLVDYRQTFAEARDQNSARIGTLQSQLDALGPKPEKGEEVQEVAALRSNLTSQLNQLRVPNVVAQEAFSRADGLISEVDRVIRDRITKNLFSRGPSPLNPVHWAQAALDLIDASRHLLNETRESLQIAHASKYIRNYVLEIAALTLSGLFIIWRGPGWALRLGDYMRQYGGRGTGVWSTLVSIGRIVFPLVGVFLLTRAVLTSGILGLRGEQVVGAIPGWVFILLLYSWIGERLYPGEESNPYALPAARHRQARLNLIAMALVLVLFSMVRLFEQIETFEASTRAIMAFPAILLGAGALLRLRQIALRRLPVPAKGENAEEFRRSGTMRIASAMRSAMPLVAVVGVGLAAAGYGTLAEALIFPSLKTLGLFGVILIIQAFVTDVYGWITGKGEAAKESLIPALAGMVIVIVSAPILALIWGVRQADLQELWSRFVEGIAVGDTVISPTVFLAFATIFAIGYMLTKLLQGALRSNLLPKTSIDPGGQSAIVAGTGYVGIGLAALIAVTGAGIDLSSLALVAGALSVGIGFGLQTIVSNFVSGIILLIERPVSKGDWIEVGGQGGYVRDISVRSTRIETFDRTDVIVPNSDLISGTVTNYTRGKTVGRVIVPVGVAYGTDTKRVEKILREIADAHPMVLMNPEPAIIFQGFGADSLDFEIRAILRDVNWVLTVKSDLNHEIARRFTEEEIEIPFAQRDLWLRNPEALAANAPKDGDDNV